MKQDMEDSEVVEREEDTDEFGIEQVVEHPISNAIMFTAMRLVRMVLALLCEAVTFVAVVPVGVFGFLSACWLGSLVLHIMLSIVCPIFGEAAPMNLFDREFILAPGTVPTYPVGRWFIQHPYVLLIPSFIIMVVAYGQAIALGVPYRWKNSPPGVNVVKCSACGKKIVSGFACSKCGAFRFEHVVLRLVWGVNVCITTVWVMHDCLLGFMGLSSGKRTR
jgi:hypothetical protein